MLCIHSLYVPLFREKSWPEGTKIFCAIPKALQNLQVLRMADLRVCHNLCEKICVLFVFSKVKNFHSQLYWEGIQQVGVLLGFIWYISADSFFQGIFWTWFFVTFFQTFFAWGVPISLGFSAIVQHMDSSVSILESASFASLENMIGSLVLGWQL